MNPNRRCQWPSCDCGTERVPCKFEDPDFHVREAEGEASGLRAMARAAGRFEECLRALSGALGLPVAESGPCDDPKRYADAIEALGVSLARTEEERARHAEARFEAEARLVRVLDRRKPIGYLKPETEHTLEPRYAPAARMTEDWMPGVFTVPVYGEPEPNDRESVASLDLRMRAAGMIPLSDLLTGRTPLEGWMAHAGVKDLASFGEWLERRHSEFLSMKTTYDLGDETKDELYEWVFAHSAALAEIVSNFRKATSGGARPPEQGHSGSGDPLDPRRPKWLSAPDAVQ